MAAIKVPVVIDGVKTIEELVQRVLDSEYKGRPLREWADRISAPRTNGDRWRAMTDEELCGELRGCPDDMDACPRIRCQDCWLAWLRASLAAEQCSALREEDGGRIISAPTEEAEDGQK